MGLLNPRIVVYSTVVLLTVSCTKTVTNYVPGADTSTAVPFISANQADPNSQANSGGVINGGGGKGVSCTKGGRQTVEVLDLYEAKTLYNLTLSDFGASEEQAKERLAQILARHFWQPYNGEMERFVQSMTEKYIQEFLNNIRFIDSGKKLKLTNDSYEPTLESNCEPVQIAMYYDESVLLVDKSLWEKLDWTNKMGLLAHESLYFLARQSGTTNSMSTRKLVGMLFSTNGVRPLAEGAPSDVKRIVRCNLKSNGFSSGHLYLYAKEQDQKRGLEALFFDLGSSGSLFRTSAFLSDLSFVHIAAPNFSGIREAGLMKDTYPARDRARFSFKGIKDGALTAELAILKGGGSMVSESFGVSCALPSDLSELETPHTEPGKFEQRLGDGSVDVLTVHRNGSLVLEQTRQVGGAGGITNFGVVPYPTVCRYREHGFITAQAQDKISYTVISAELGDVRGLKDSAHCDEYIASFNRKAASGSVRFTIRKSEFIKVD